MRGSWAEPFLPQTYMMLPAVHAAWLALFVGLVLAVSADPMLLGGRKPPATLLRVGLIGAVLIGTVFTRTRQLNSATD